jgi:hypothetical protein
LGCSPGCFPRQQILHKTFKLSYYFYIAKNYVRYNYKGYLWHKNICIPLQFFHLLEKKYLVVFI